MRSRRPVILVLMLGIVTILVIRGRDSRHAAKKPAAALPSPSRQPMLPPPMLRSPTTDSDQIEYHIQSLSPGQYVLDARGLETMHGHAIVEYTFDFGDGTVEKSKEASATHVYKYRVSDEDRVTYSTTITATDEAGHTQSRTEPVVVDNRVGKAVLHDIYPVVVSDCLLTWNPEQHWKCALDIRNPHDVAVRLEVILWHPEGGGDPFAIKNNRMPASPPFPSLLAPGQTAAGDVSIDDLPAGTPSVAFTLTGATADGRQSIFNWTGVVEWNTKAAHERVANEKAAADRLGSLGRPGQP